MARPRKEDTKVSEESFTEVIGVDAPLKQEDEQVSEVVTEVAPKVVVVQATPKVAPEVTKTRVDIRRDLAKEEADLRAALAEVKKKKAGTAVFEYATVSHLELIRRNRELRRNKKPSQRTEIANIMRSLMKNPGSNPHNPIIIGKGK